MSSQPPGTFLPNTKVTVGSHKVYIEKYLSEGGFAHVYVVRVPRENNKHDVAVLKRVAVPDKEHLANMRTEVETMKKLKGHKHIVTYIDSHASQLKGGGYEVFLLMEFCNGSGLIDFMNTRLQHRLTEPEILKIFGDCAEGVACMHYLKPPLLHRDLKVENVLISKSSSGTPLYKICDFGSAAPPRPAAKTVEEGRLIEEDVQKHTTMQYRSPEMIDVWRKQPIDEKADIWALGVLLYKLCYYTTPFEDVGQMAILNASFKYPSYPAFSDRLKKLIAWMLKEDPKDRPNIYQVVKEVCSMRGTPVPIKDIYANRTQSEARRNEALPSAEDMSSAPIGLQKTTPQVQVQALPDIAPMRRGRPTAPTSQAPTAAKPAPSPSRGDPFAALDSKNYDIRAGAVDELSKRFPSLDEFSIAHEGGKFPFSTTDPPLASPPPNATPEPRESISERVSQALADEVFASKSPPAAATSRPKPQEVHQPQSRTRSPPKPTTATVRDLKQNFGQQPTVHQPLPVRPSVQYKSTATGSSPPLISPKKLPEVSNRRIWRVPDQSRSDSQPRPTEAAQAAASSLQPSLPPSHRPALQNAHRSKSHIATLGVSQASTSSRPSLEGGRPSANDVGNASISRTKSLNNRSRPASMYVSSNMDFLRDQEQSRKRPSMEIRRPSRQPSQGREPEPEDNPITDDIDFLRRTEESDVDRRKSMKEAMKIHGSHHRKRSSLDALRSGAKGMLSGRFGDAFKRFEQNQPDEGRHLDTGLLTPEARDHDDEPQLLSPISGSEATLSRHSEGESAIDETEDLPPDVRRELERRRLSQEEKRVADAAAAYRARVATQGTGSVQAPTRASTIQRRVQSLLDEGRQSPQPKKTAEDYGKNTDLQDEEARPVTLSTAPATSGNRPPVLARKPMMNMEMSNNPYPKTRPQRPESPAANMPPPASVPSDAAPLQRVTSRLGPSAPPKPKALRTGGNPWPPPQSPNTDNPQPKPAGLAALLAKDLEGVPDYPPRDSSNRVVSREDDLDSFSKRYPSLSGIEMVETEINGRR
ncbi:related to serine threonine kinase ARK1 [Lecanosticta acicola]|uniref:non-specific serine/threonine protein kinase n=1 Tax=Lecanosticta acicola TaxID=111012 RepID=A0AAI9EBH8_9PEZI|nr:related to serine threonine kinase ARK1 [Lecanosticta acicola]